MPNLTKLSLTTTAIILAFSTPIFAQNKVPKMPSDAHGVDIFTSADVDTDGTLNRAEFVSYVVMASDNGEADYSAIKISGDYDNHFNTKDYNADGLLSAEELNNSEMDYSEDEANTEQDTPSDEATGK